MYRRGQVVRFAYLPGGRYSAQGEGSSPHCYLPAPGSALSSGAYRAPTGNGRSALRRSTVNGGGVHDDVVSSLFCLMEPLRPVKDECFGGSNPAQNMRGSEKRVGPPGQGRCALAGRRHPSSAGLARARPCANYLSSMRGCSPSLAVAPFL